jgi:hypothetical protein
MYFLSVHETENTKKERRFQEKPQTIQNVQQTAGPLASLCSRATYPEVNKFH